MNVAFTISGASVFGRMCLMMIIGTRVPEATAASTNSLCRRSASAPPRRLRDFTDERG